MALLLSSMELINRIRMSLRLGILGWALTIAIQGVNCSSELLRKRAIGLILTERVEMETGVLP